MWRESRKARHQTRSDFLEAQTRLVTAKMASEDFGNPVFIGDDFRDVLMGDSKLTSQSGLLSPSSSESLSDFQDLSSGEFWSESPYESSQIGYNPSTFSISVSHVGSMSSECETFDEVDAERSVTGMHNVEFPWVTDKIGVSPSVSFNHVGMQSIGVSAVPEVAVSDSGFGSSPEPTLVVTSSNDLAPETILNSPTGSSGSDSTAFFDHNGQDTRLASYWYPELEDILRERPPLERMGVAVPTAQGTTPLCPLCGLRPVETTVQGSDVCGYCAKNKFGVPSDNTDAPQFGEYTSAVKTIPVGGDRTKHVLIRGSYPGKHGAGERWDSICGHNDLKATPDNLDATAVADHITCDKCAAKWERGDHPYWQISREAGLFDWLGDHLNPEHNTPSFDWCRFRRNQHCFYPKDLDRNASAQAGYAVWIPEDRGPCHRQMWEDQKQCPISEPGPRSRDPHALTDATVPWGQGGQRGGHSNEEPMTLPGHWSVLNSSEDVPAQPGTSPIPEGHIRLFHYTHPDNLASIREHGLLASHARGDGGTGPNEPSSGIWASTKAPDDNALHAHPNIEFHAHPDEISQRAEHPGYSDPQEWAKGNHHVIMHGDVKPENIVAIHEPWHAGYHYLNDMKDDVKKGEYDWVHDDKGTEAQYGKAIRKIKSEGSQKSKLATADPDFRFEFTASWSDVRAKATKLRKEGHVRIISTPSQSNPYITAEVMGDTNAYQTTLLRSIGGKSVAGWACGCAWAHYSWGRSGRWAKYEGRMCSHALATLYQAQAEEMFGGKVKEVERKPAWQDSQTHIVQPGEYKDKAREIGPWRIGVLGAADPAYSNQVAHMDDWSEGAHPDDGPRTGTFGLRDNPGAPGSVHVHKVESWPNSYYLRNLSVPSEHRNRGHGTRLMNEVMDEHDKNGSTLVLDTAQPHLQAWYHDMGFQPHGEKDDFFGQRMVRHPGGAKTAAGRIRMYRNSEDAVTYCPKCKNFYGNHYGADGKDFMDKFKPIRHGDPSIGAGSIEVCSGCGKTIVNSLPKDAAALPKHKHPQKCKYCKKSATKGYRWAEGMAYIPVCHEHEDQARSDIEDKNHDEVNGTFSIGDDDEGGGDSDSGGGTTAGFHPLSTDPALAAPPIVLEASMALEAGESAAEVMEYLTSLGVAQPLVVMAQALVDPTVVKDPRGVKHTIVEFGHDDLYTDAGETLDPDTVVHPNWDPISGLDWHKTATGGHLTNPADQTNDWHHGTPHDFNSFDDERPEDDDMGDYDAEDEDRVHWNTHLGQHWTSLKPVAKQFARGKYTSRPGDGREGHVITAHLGIKKPKVYSLESEMDKEAVRHAWDKHEAHDPYEEHSNHCHNEDCYGLHEHESGDHVDRTVKRFYTDRHHASTWLNSHPQKSDIADSFKHKLESEGHDGVQYGNEVEGPMGHACAITFHTHQVHDMNKVLEHEAMLRLAAGADTNGVMIALVPPRYVLNSLNVEGGEPVDQMHITVAYLGKTDGIDEHELHKAVAAFATTAPQMHARITGFGQFNKGVHVALVDIPGIDQFRRHLMTFLAGADISVTDEHGVQPHITLAYTDEDMQLEDHDADHEFELEWVTVAYGGEWTQYPLQGKQDFAKAAMRTTAEAFDERGMMHGEGIDTISPHNKPGGAINPGATHFEDLPQHHQDRIRKVVTDNAPVKPGPGTEHAEDPMHEHMVQNLMALHRRTQRDNPEINEAGAKWYGDAHKQIRKWGRKYGVSPTHMAGAVAALSPNTTWESNMTTAHYMARHLGSKTNEKFDVDPEKVKGEQWEDEKGEKHDHTPGKAFRDMHPHEAASALFLKSKRHDDLRDEIGEPTKSTGEMSKSNWSYAPNVQKAARILGTNSHPAQHPNDVLSGHKVRSFFNNLTDPHNRHGRDDVTMDTHAISAASGAKISSMSKTIKKIFDPSNADAERNHNVHGTYSYFASAYRDAHHRLQDSGEIGKDVHPHDFQAQVWGGWKHLMDRKRGGNAASEYPVAASLHVQEHPFRMLDWRTVVAAANIPDISPLDTIDPWYDPQEGEPDPDLFPDENEDWHKKNRSHYTQGHFPISSTSKRVLGYDPWSIFVVAAIEGDSAQRSTTLDEDEEYPHGMDMDSEYWNRRREPEVTHHQIPSYMNPTMGTLHEARPGDSPYSQTGMWADQTAGEGLRNKPKLLKALPHSKCECDSCMSVREQNHAAREMMNWRRPEYKGTGNYISPEEEHYRQMEMQGSLDPDDEFAFEGELHDPATPALPETTSAEPEDERPPSNIWNLDHATDAPNPGSAGPADFGRPLDPNNYHEDMGIREMDESLLAPGAAPTNPVGQTQDWSEGLDVMASLQPGDDPDLAAGRSWLMSGGSSSNGNTPAAASNGDIAAMAKRVLTEGTGVLKEGAKKFTPQEQHALIHEGGGTTKARNFGSLDIKGTHYEAIDAALANDEEDDSWLGL